MQGYERPVDESAPVRPPRLPWPLQLAVVGAVAECAAVAWTLAWQRSFGQTPVLSPPQVLLLAGAAIGLAAATRAPRARPLPFGLIVLGGLLTALGSLADARTETMAWNAPHLVVTCGLALSLFGWAIVARAAHPAGGRPLAYWLFLASQELVVWFALDGYVLEATLDLVIYMVVASVVLLPVLVVAAAYGPGELGALKLTALTVLFGWLVVLPFALVGGRGPDPVPWLLILAGLVLDLDWLQEPRTSWRIHAVRSGLGFALVLLLALQVSSPSPLPWLVEPLDETFQRPWTRFVEGAVLVSALPAMLSALLGLGLAGLLPRARDR